MARSCSTCHQVMRKESHMIMEGYHMIKDGAGNDHHSN